MWELKKHCAEEHEAMPDQPYVCIYCCKVFAIEDGVKDSRKKKECMKSHFICSLADRDNKTIMCVLCLKNGTQFRYFDTKSKLSDHLNVKSCGVGKGHDFQQYCNSVTDERVTQQSQRYNNTYESIRNHEEWACLQCEDGRVTFSSHAEKVEHFMVHHPKLMYRCYIPRYGMQEDNTGQTKLAADDERWGKNPYREVMEKKKKKNEDSDKGDELFSDNDWKVGGGLENDSDKESVKSIQARRRRTGSGETSKKKNEVEMEDDSEEESVKTSDKKNKKRKLSGAEGKKKQAKKKAKVTEDSSVNDQTSDEDEEDEDEEKNEEDESEENSSDEDFEPPEKKPKQVARRTSERKKKPQQTPEKKVGGKNVKKENEERSEEGQMKEIIVEPKPKGYRQMRCPLCPSSKAYGLIKHKKKVIDDTVEMTSHVVKEHGEVMNIQTFFSLYKIVSK